MRTTSWSGRSFQLTSHLQARNGDCLGATVIRIRTRVAIDHTYTNLLHSSTTGIPFHR